MGICNVLYNIIWHIWVIPTYSVYRLYDSYPHSVYVQLEGPLRNLWFPTLDTTTAYETSFIVVGPIPNDNPGHLTTGLDNTSCRYGLTMAIRYSTRGLVFVCDRTIKMVTVQGNSYQQHISIIATDFQPLIIVAYVCTVEHNTCSYMYMSTCTCKLSH